MNEMIVNYLQRQLRQKRRALRKAELDEKMLLLHDIAELTHHIAVIKLL